ncbi:hypothetical protein BCR39DRAFT_560937 [Naematelia encephala]|uniref:Uncharacterized protein n=1 Tax=Naematelia encephala TaxID=71784 RepID=A0A1Y2AST0_9TREE|nr:hypothetical protein BCR39DRAFT_560937 [Naematelia encephala]
MSSVNVESAVDGDQAKMELRRPPVTPEQTEEIERPRHVIAGENEWNRLLLLLRVLALIFLCFACFLFTRFVLHNGWTSLIDKASSDRSPRSACLTMDEANLCTTWVNYDSRYLPNGASADLANFSMSCAKNGGRSEFKDLTTDDGVVFICVSGRASGASAS